MFTRLIHYVRSIFSRPTQVDVIHRQQQQESPQYRMFNLPPDWQPIDSVIDTTHIPGTGLEIGTVARVMETNRQERLDFNHLHGVSAGCNHFIYSINEIGGKCPICEQESLEFLNKGLISLSQAEQRNIYCKSCASYCMACFRQICATHTRLFQCPDGIYIPLCPMCEEATHKSLISRLISFLFGK